jgi:hypothetical protein
LHHNFNLGAISNIHRDYEGIATPSLHGFREVLQSIQAARSQNDLTALLGKQARGILSKPGGGTGEQDDFVGEFGHLCFLKDMK